MNATDLEVSRLDEVLTDFADQLRRGELPAVEEYAQHHPELGDLLRELLPTVQNVENLKRSRAAAFRFTPSPEVFSRLGSYRILGVLGQGGMGAVLKAFDEKLQREVAVKI